MEGALRLAVGRPLDPAVGRVRRVAADPGQGQGTRVHPDAVAIAVREHDRPVRHDRVEQLLRRGPVRVVRHIPAAALDPGQVGMRLRVGADRLDDGGRAARDVVEAAPDPVQPAVGRVDVSVAEAGQRHPPGQVDPPGPWPDERRDVPSQPDRDDPPVADGAGLARPPSAVHRHDRSARQDEVGGLVEAWVEAGVGGQWADSGRRRGVRSRVAPERSRHPARGCHARAGRVP